VDMRYGTLPLQEYCEWANREIFLGVMIERKEAVEDIEAIARTEGLDLLLVGPADLSQSLGVRGEVTHPLMQEAIARVAEACNRHGKHWAVAGTVPSYAEQMAMGARFFNIVNEMSVLMEGFRRAKEQFEQAVES